MALSTYSELKEAVATWLARSGDTQITGNVADFITMAEAHMNRHLRARQQETSLQFMTTSGAYNLPDDYLAWRTMTYLGATYIALDYVHPDLLTRLHPAVEAGVPRHFTIEANNIYVRPYDDDTTHDFIYFAKVPALASASDTNWVLAAHPDLYLSSALAEANAFLINPDHASLWAQKRDMIINEISILSEKTKGPSQVIPVGTFY